MSARALLFSVTEIVVDDIVPAAALVGFTNPVTGILPASSLQAFLWGVFLTAAVLILLVELFVDVELVKDETSSDGEDQ